MNEILLITLGMFLLMFVGMAWGIPIGFLLGAIAIIFAYFLWGPLSLRIIPIIVFSWMTMSAFICLPLFVFMAFILEGAGVAEALYDAIYRWVGSLNGGLAMGTILICTLFAALCGGPELAIATMGIIALPSMLRRGYDKHLVMGGIMAGGALGSLIPPSIIMIIFALFTGESIGALFIGGIIPGLILSALFIIYTGIRCFLNPSLGPAQPPEERVGWREKFVSLKAVILPIVIVAGMMGSIFLGIATPTEASAVGALGAIISAAINRRLNWQMLKTACFQTLAVTAMIYWIFIGAVAFGMVYTGLGATQLIRILVTGLEVSPWVILIFMQISFFFLGCILTNTAILMITLPVYYPIITALGFNPLWFGILYVINMNMGMLTPPFGYSLFYMKAVVPPEIGMGDIYRSIAPFVALQMLGLVLVMIFPQLVLFLPNLMIRPGG